MRCLSRKKPTLFAARDDASATTTTETTWTEDSATVEAFHPQIPHILILVEDTDRCSCPV